MQRSLLLSLTGIILILFMMGTAFGQTILPKELTKLPGGLGEKAYVAEINNDEYKDIVVTQRINADSVVAYIFLQTDSLVFALTDTIRNLSSDLIFFSDIDNSGQLDLIIVGKNPDQNFLTGLLDYNAADGFQNTTILQVDSIAACSFADINNDGYKDLLLIEYNDETPDFKLFLQNENFAFDHAGSYTGISDFLITSLNGDGYSDLVLYNNSSGEMNFLTNQNEKWDTVTTIFEKSISQWQNADINHDGKADILITSNDENSNMMLVLINDSGEFIEKEISTFLNKASFSSPGDFTNDGYYDISITTNKSEILELDSLGDLKRSVPIDSSGTLLVNGVGDIDDDGDLDWIGFRNGADSVEIYLLINQPLEQNIGPEYVKIMPPVTIGNKTTFAWNTSVDDKTPSLSLSYDFYIRSDDEDKYIITSDYDLENAERAGARNFSRHGYTLYDSLFQTNELGSGKYFWGVAGVDNAYYSSTDIINCSGPCSNKSFVSQCLEIIKADTLVCINDTLNLYFGETEDSIVWSSLKKGFLGNGMFLKFPVSENDEVYVVATPKKPCEDPLNTCTKNYALSINAYERSDYILETLTICQDSVTTFTLDGDFETIKWHTASGTLSDSPTVQFSSLTDSLIFVQLKESGANCTIYDTLVLERIQKPGINFFPDDLEACINSSVLIEVNIPDSLVADISYTLTANNSPLDVTDPNVLIAEPVKIVITAVYVNCHVLSDTMHITPINPPTIAISGDNQVFPGEAIVLTASGASHYNWTPEDYLGAPNAASTTATPIESTLYFVKGWDAVGCEGQATFLVEVVPSVYVPELFTPNNDGNNDFLVIHGNDIDHINFSLFDGNGRKIYQSSSASEIILRGWDGNINGDPVTPGTYVWRIEGQFKNGTAITYKGKTVGELKIVR